MINDSLVKNIGTYMCLIFMHFAVFFLKRTLILTYLVIFDVFRFLFDLSII